MEQTTVFKGDEYLGFSWRGTHSSAYNCFITNSGEDLKFISAPNFSNEFAQSMFQNKSYFLGTSIERRSLMLNLCCDRITLKEYRNLLKWLDLYEVGFFQLDYEPWYGYDVKIAALQEATKLPYYQNEQGEMLYIITFAITFETIGDVYAIHKNMTADFINGGNEYIGNTIYNDLEETETEIDFSFEKTTPSGEYLYNFEINNLGDVETEFSILFQNANGTYELIRKSSKWDEVGESIMFFQTKDFGSDINFPIEYDSLSGQLTVLGILAESLIIQGWSIIDFSSRKSNITLRPGENYFCIKSNKSLDFMVFFRKKTYVI